MPPKFDVAEVQSYIVHLLQAGRWHRALLSLRLSVQQHGLRAHEATLPRLLVPAAHCSWVAALAIMSNFATDPPLSLAGLSGTTADALAAELIHQPSAACASMPMLQRLAVFRVIRAHLSPVAYCHALASVGHRLGWREALGALRTAERRCGRFPPEVTRDLGHYRPALIRALCRHGCWADACSAAQPLLAAAAQGRGPSHTADDAALAAIAKALQRASCKREMNALVDVAIAAQPAAVDGHAAATSWPQLTLQAALHRACSGEWSSALAIVSAVPSSEAVSVVLLAAWNHHHHHQCATSHVRTLRGDAQFRKVLRDVAESRGVPGELVLPLHDDSQWEVASRALCMPRSAATAAAAVDAPRFIAFCPSWEIAMMLAARTAPSCQEAATANALAVCLRNGAPPALTVYLCDALQAAAGESHLTAAKPTAPTAPLLHALHSCSAAAVPRWVRIRAQRAVEGHLLRMDSGRAAMTPAVAAALTAAVAAGRLPECRWDHASRLLLQNGNRHVRHVADLVAPHCWVTATLAATAAHSTTPRNVDALLLRACGMPRCAVRQIRTELLRPSVAPSLPGEYNVWFRAAQFASGGGPLPPGVVCELISCTAASGAWEVALGAAAAASECDHPELLRALLSTMHHIAAARRSATPVSVVIAADCIHREYSWATRAPSATQSVVATLGHSGDWCRAIRAAQRHIALPSVHWDAPLFGAVLAALPAEAWEVALRAASRSDARFDEGSARCLAHIAAQTKTPAVHVGALFDALCDRPGSSFTKEIAFDWVEPLLRAGCWQAALGIAAVLVERRHRAAPVMRLLCSAYPLDRISDIFRIPGAHVSPHFHIVIGRSASAEEASERLKHALSVLQLAGHSRVAAISAAVGVALRTHVAASCERGGATAGWRAALAILSSMQPSPNDAQDRSRALTDDAMAALGDALGAAGRWEEAMVLFSHGCM